MQQPRFEPANPRYVDAVRDGFSRQGLMRNFGAELSSIAPGTVDIVCPFKPSLSQQNGFFHGGVTGAIADSAAGFAALTLFEAGTGVLTVEYKINLLAVADGERMIARGRVERAGRTLVICRADVVVQNGSHEKAVAIALVTLMRGPPAS